MSTVDEVTSDLVIGKPVHLFELSMHIYFDCINIHVTCNEYTVTFIDMKVYIELQMIRRDY